MTLFQQKKYIDYLHNVKYRPTTRVLWLFIDCFLFSKQHFPLNFKSSLSVLIPNECKICIYFPDTVFKYTLW